MLVLVLTTFVATSKSTAQTADSGDKVNAAIRLMDSGLYSESEALLQEVISLDAKNFRAWYELAFLQYMKKDYDQAVKTALKAAKMPDASDLAYQVAGNAADYAGDSKRAAALYREGLKKFPDSGCLYLELGNLSYNDRAYLDALDLYEQGIAVEPDYPSAYRSAATIFLSSSEPLWGMLYGEIFMNLERNGKRTEAMGKSLFNAYKNAVTIGVKDGERDIVYGFTKNNTIYADKGELQIPFPLIFSLIVEGVLPKDAVTVDLETLNRMRCGFVEKFFTVEEDGSNYAGLYPNILFDYQRRIAQAGHLEAYNYWIFGGGDEAAADGWRTSHPEQWDAFIEWFNENPMIVDREHRFHRSQYDNATMKYNQ